LNFTNTTSWAKELAAISLSLLLKIEGGGCRIVLSPLLALNLRKKTVLL
jgi:hypothetical protein